METTLSGVVYDSAGKVPLYNAAVYVPSRPPAPLTAGATCDRCDAAVLSPIVSALTDTKGHFVLKDVPVGSAIPLVIQVGKWRRQVTIPTTAPCVDTALTDPELTRLPRNQAEGDIPRIAIATGGADSMECLPRRMGLSDSEFTTNTGSGRVHLFAGTDHVTGQANGVASGFVRLRVARWARVRFPLAPRLVFGRARAGTQRRDVGRSHGA